MNKKLLIGAISAAVVFSVLLFIIIFNINNPKKAFYNQNNEVTVPTDLSNKEKEDSTNESSTEVETNGFYNPLTGLYVTEDLSSRRPIAVMLDNFYSARPQAALSEADIIYEVLAEGLITRYMAVFYSQLPEHVGPIRSSRPYFVEKALEFNPLYVHVGGSMQAMSDIRKFELADMDGLTSSAFWREKHKKAPHNMYTSSEALIAEAKRLKYEDKVTLDFLDFNTEFVDLNGITANEITFVYKEPLKNDPVGYYTSYKYNDEKKLYFRYTNGTPHLDENTKTHLTCTNILVQYANTKVLDNEGRLDVDLVTSGKGKYYTGGKVIEVTWSKKSAQSKTEFWDLNGLPIKLNPGVTWFQIMKSGITESIK